MPRHPRFTVIQVVCTFGDHLGHGGVLDYLERTYRTVVEAEAHLFVDRMVQAVPSLQEKRRQHVAENEELLSTVLLDEITGQMIQSYAASIDAGTAITGRGG